MIQLLENNPLFSRAMLTPTETKKYVGYRPNANTPLTRADLFKLINEPSFIYIQNNIIYFSLKSI